MNIGGEKIMITVYPGAFGEKCWIGNGDKKDSRGCTGKPRYMVFGTDGKPKMSRLEANVCPDCLHKAIDKLIKEGHPHWEKTNAYSTNADDYAKALKPLLEGCGLLPATSGAERNK